MKNKRVLIVFVIILIVAIIAIFIFGKKKNEEVIVKPTILESNFLSVFELNDIENTEYEIEKVLDTKVAEKYIANSNVYKLNANVEFGEKTGEIIYIRTESNNLNIFQTKYRIDELDSISSQVGIYMEIFKKNSLNYLGIDSNTKADSEVLYGTSKSTVHIPLEESIFDEGRLYSITYKINEDSESYDINFYRDGQYLVCEFSKII